MPSGTSHLATTSARLAPAILVAAGLACTPAPRRAPPDTPAVPLRILVISDLNSSYGSTTYAPEVRRAIELARTELRPDLVLLAGDMVAGQAPRLADSTVRAMWDAFDRVVTTPLREAGIPLVVTVGNHDASAYPAHARDRRLAAEYWRAEARAAAPAMLDGAHFPFRYTMRVGDAFIAVWDGTNEESSTNDTLVDWLRDALRSDAARSARHRVVLSHLPLYGVAVGRSQRGEVLAGGDSLRRQLEEWGATMFVSGHHHAFFPARRGTIELLHSGAIGDGPRPLVGHAAEPYKAFAMLELFPDSVHVRGFRIDGERDALTPVALETMPRVICGHGGWVARRDVARPDTICAPSPS